MENSKETETFVQQPKHIAKFAIMSIIGGFIFLFPIPQENGSFNIPLGIAIDWLEGVFNNFHIGTYAPEGQNGVLSIQYILALIMISVSFLGSVFVLIAKPTNEKLKSTFAVSPLYFLTRAVAFAIVWMIFLGVGPAFIIESWTGDLMINLAAKLVVVFIFLGPTMSILTSFGLMEFAGVSIQKVIRFLFTLPGRASIDLIASWFGSSAAAILITSGQHKQGFYTGREAAVITTNFAFVSLPFTFIIASTLDVVEHFLLFYAIICVVCLILAIIMPRIWPLRNLPDVYIEGVGKQINEEVPEGESVLGRSVYLASKKASETSFRDIAVAGINNWLDIFMDLIPIILAWGTIALIIEQQTPLFDWISWPMEQYLNVLGVADASEIATATIVGFVDMFIPALMAGAAVVETRFIIGILSIVQIIYLAETGALIIKSKIPLGLGKLFIIFIMRTIIALPIIVLLTRLFF